MRCGSLKSSGAKYKEKRHQWQIFLFIGVIMFETIVSIIVGIFVCAGNALIFFIVARQIRRVPSVQHNDETLCPISRAKVWSNERYYVGSNEIFHYNGSALGRVGIQLLQRILRHKMVDARRKCEPMLSIGEYF